MPQRDSIDAFYTPMWLAEELAAAMPDDLRGAIFDPTVGEGALLSAVRDRFGDRVSFLGVDIDPSVVSRLRRIEPTWTVSRADMLAQRSRAASPAWRAASAEVTAVVLNPPFSYRGHGGAHITYGQFAGRVAPAMRFLTEVLKSLHPTAGFYVVLPDGALEAERHEELWDEIRQRFQVSRLRRFKSTSFRGARVSTSLVRLLPGVHRAPTKPTPAPWSDVPGCRCVEVVRGRVPVHSVRGTSPTDPAPFLHTTGLRSSTTTQNAPNVLSDDAPLVIIVRVGRWTEPTVVEVGRVVLSDCLIGLRPRTRSQVERLRESITRASDDFRSAYRGTGAQYLTLNAVVQRLEALGWRAHVVKASSRVEPCCCAPVTLHDDSLQLGSRTRTSESGEPEGLVRESNA